MDTRSQLEWTLGLYDYSTAIPPSNTFDEFYALTGEFLSSLGLFPSHIAAEGDEHTGKLLKIDSIGAKRLLKSRFDGVSTLSVVSCSKATQEPTFDRMISANLSWTMPSEILLCLTTNDALAQFSGPVFDELLKKLLQWRIWAFGYALRDKVCRQPEFHVMSIDNGRLSNDEKNALIRWYRASTAERLVRPRNIYPINIWNQKQISRQIGTQTLGDFIRSKQSTSIEEIEGLTIWKVVETEVDTLRAELSTKGALISLP